ncbi:MAG: hypothetical protein OEM59_13730 [Rhodospirillales bacterium]|nr:hypothetical protein [Rhodospirillales bacterium]
MQRNDQFDRKDFNRPARESREQGTVVLWNAVLLFGLCVMFASLAPGELFAASLSSLLVFATVSCAITALMRGEVVLEDRPTHWDAAAAFLAMSIVLSWFVDPEAIGAFMTPETS